VFISVRDADKDAIVPVARSLAKCGYRIMSTAGTYDVLFANDVPVERMSKLAEGRPNIKDLIKNQQVQLIINTPTKKGPQTDEGAIRAMAVLHKVPIVTTVTGAIAAARAIEAMQSEGWDVKPLQEYFSG
jgi:carbamoyl-phosphate synthase large subunit